MPVHQKAEKSFAAETRGGDVVAKLKAKLPLNPFGNVSGLVVANAGEAVASCEVPRFLSDGSQAGAALNPNSYFFVTGPKTTDISETDGSISYEATLTAFITDLIPGDPEGRVHNLRETVEQSDIWSEFASVLTAKPSVSVSSEGKPSKEKKPKREKKVKKEVKTDADDPWNTDYVSSTYTSSSSNESPSQSKSTEKSKPATPPKVDEDDPWA
jgi:hypothetical protein